MARIEFQLKNYQLAKGYLEKAPDSDEKVIVAKLLGITI